MAAVVINGTDLGLYIEVGSAYVLVGCADENSVSIETEMLEASCKESGDWYDGVPGGHNWTMETSGLVIVDTPSDATKYRAFDFLAAQINKTKLKVKFGTATAGHTTYSGFAYITSSNISAPNKENGTYSISLQGVGPLTPATNAA